MTSVRDEIDVRRITLEDVDGFWSCVDAVARERRWLAMTQAFPIESTRQFVASNIAKGVPQRVALHDGRVVGWCDIVPNAQEGLRHVGTLGMGLLQPYRGRGLGRRLLEETLADAERGGIWRVQLQVFASNVAAVRLYERAGFQREGTLRMARFLDGVPEDITCMARLSPREPFAARGASRGARP